MFIRTPRLLLRPAWPEDAAALYAALPARALGDDGESRPRPDGLDDAVTWLRADVARDEANFLILERTGSDPVLAGGIGIRRDAATGAHELGCWLVPGHQGRGLASEAAQAVMAMARESLRLPRLVARAADDPASGRFLARLGFVKTGVAFEPDRQGAVYEAVFASVMLAA